MQAGRHLEQEIPLPASPMQPHELDKFEIHMEQARRISLQEEFHKQQRRIYLAKLARGPKFGEPSCSGLNRES